MPPRPHKQPVSPCPGDQLHQCDKVVSCHKLPFSPSSEWPSSRGVFVTQSCPTLCDPMDHNPQGSSIHGISQARKLEWAAILFPEDLSQG